MRSEMYIYPSNTIEKEVQFVDRTVKAGPNMLEGLTQEEVSILEANGIHPVLAGGDDVTLDRIREMSDRHRVEFESQQTIPVMKQAPKMRLAVSRMQNAKIKNAARTLLG